MAKLATAGQSYTSVFKVKLDSTRSSKYMAEFYAYLYCFNSNCAKAYDYLSISVTYTNTFPNYDNKNDYEFKRIYLNEKTNEASWFKVNASFFVEYKNYKYVLFSINFGRFYDNPYAGYIAFDDLVITRLASSASKLYAKLPMALVLAFQLLIFYVMRFN